MTDTTGRVLSQEEAPTNAALRELSAKLLHAHDECCRRLARQLHDSAAQSLTAVSLSLNLLSKLPGIETAPEAGKMLAECAAMLEDCIREVRTVSTSLHPLLLEDAGLEPALRNYLSEFENRTGIAVQLHVSTDHQRWAGPVQTTVFRFVQESLSNIQRRDPPGRAQVRIVESQARLTIEVEDNGAGFYPEGVDTSGHPVLFGLGLAGVRERARFLGGDLNFRSTPQGSTLELAIPIDEQD